MQVRHDLALTLPWMAQGTELVRAAADQADLARPTRLPGWTGAHVLAHLAGNARALLRLAAWGRTGVETPMYASREQRAAEIEAGAAADAQLLRQQFADTAGQLSSALEALPESALSAQVRSATGRPLPVRELPWMRIREVWLHALDLDERLSLQDLPEQLRGELLADVLASFQARAQVPRLELRVDDQCWQLGTGGAPQSLVLDRDEALAWLTGRPSGRPAAGQQLPAMPPWL